MPHKKSKKKKRIDYKKYDYLPARVIVARFYRGKLNNRQMKTIISHSGKNYGWQHTRTDILQEAYEER